MSRAHPAAAAMSLAHSLQRSLAFHVVASTLTLATGFVGGTCLHFWRTGDVIKTDTFCMQWKYGQPRQQSRW